MRVFVTGGTGMIGRHLVAKLKDRGDQPVILTRRSDEARRDPDWRGLTVIPGDPGQAGPWQREVDGCDAVVNLAGQPVFGGRWDAGRKAQIRDSRVHAADHIVEALARASSRPSAFIQGSAIGYYGMAPGDDPSTEESPSGTDFLAVVCRELEDAARPAEALGVRLATIRTGIVLEKGQGSLKVMTPIFRWLPGGAAPVGGGEGGLLGLGKGQQWMSWIHIEDIVGLFLLALDGPEVLGPINGTAPNPVRNVDFSKALAKALHRPFLKYGPPDAALRLLFGEVADVIVKGRKVVPARAGSLGYRFRFPELAGALDDIFARRKPGRTATPRPAVAGAGH
ncbi:TIGR01777 family oxidoreductase [Tundrisphaera sp. TA3]|uniref:TIGR01777 family oxidoreductase n=1 Tax=Tundrisphaera sp. TA3 TaxID=3435775 RepID=UPI003EB6C468